MYVCVTECGLGLLLATVGILEFVVAICICYICLGSHFLSPKVEVNYCGTASLLCH